MIYDNSKDDLETKIDCLKSYDTKDLFFLSDIERKILISEKSSLILKKKENLEIYKNLVKNK